MKYTYLLVNFFTIIIPLLFSFHPKIKFYRTWKEFFLAVLPVALVFIIWDVIFTYNGIWNFNPQYTSGVTIFNLPLEEHLFFICIPFSCIFTYYCLNKFYDLSWRPKTESIFCIAFSLILITTGLIFNNRLYTAVTLVSTGLVCLFLKYVINVSWFGKAITVYAILLIPFFIVNGILTGTGLQEPVVRYNNAENLGIRILTIPVEDIFYGLELILLILWLYLYLINKKLKMHSKNNPYSDKTVRPTYRTSLLSK